MSGDLLNRPCRRTSHGQMRTEHVTQPVSSTRGNASFTPSFPNVLAHDILRERQAIVQAEHPRTFQMAMVRRADANRAVIGTYRNRPPFGAVTCPRHSER